MSITRTVANVGDKTTDTVNKVGDAINQGVTKAADWVTEKAHAVEQGIEKAMGKPVGAERILEHMEVIASCGKHVGTVDCVEGTSIKLTKSDPTAGGRHHSIPLSWVDHVDQHVHLNKNSKETFEQWCSC